MNFNNHRIKFLKPATDVTNNTLNVDKNETNVSEDSSVTSFIYNRNHSLSLQIQRQRLPIFNYRNHILYLLEKYQCLVLVGETGCGKSTQIPQYLLETGWTKDDSQIGIIEPRRVAAITLASRVAEESGTLLGEEVGYAVRFDHCVTDKTCVKYVTTGVFIREMMADPLLTKYSVVILDEAHERNIETDIIMGLLKKVIRKRKTLRIIVASATLDAENIKEFFNLNNTKDDTKDTSVIMSVQGRNYAVETYFMQEPAPDYVTSTVDTVIKLHETEPPGDILAFLTGQEEVDRAAELLHSNIRENSFKNKLQLLVLPMYGSLPYPDQLKVFRSCDKKERKVILSTNIAETSVTIPGIVYVIDCGFVKMRWFSTDTHTDRLVVVPVSKASAEQRAGRAGRVRAGKCYRLYTEEDFAKLPLNTLPEMQRTNLLNVVLQLKALGVDNVLRFNFPSPPSAKNLLLAYELLYALNAIDLTGNLTKDIGTTMAELGVEPLFGKMLITSPDFGCSEEILTIVSMLHVETIFIKPQGGQASIKARVQKRNFEVHEGDLITLLNAYNGFKTADKQQAYCSRHFLSYKSLKRVEEIRNRIKHMLHNFKIPLITADGNVLIVSKCITAGLFPNSAYLHPSGVYKTVRGDIELYIHPNSVFYSVKQPSWVVFSEILYTNKLYMKDITRIQEEWLIEVAPHFYRKSTLQDVLDQ